MSDDPRCRQCGGPRTDQSPEDLCPQCLTQGHIPTGPTIAGGGSVLETLAGTLDSPPCVQLRDDPGDRVDGTSDSGRARSIRND